MDLNLAAGAGLRCGMNHSAIGQPFDDGIATFQGSQWADRAECPAQVGQLACLMGQSPGHAAVERLAQVLQLFPPAAQAQERPFRPQAGLLHGEALRRAIESIAHSPMQPALQFIQRLPLVLQTTFRVALAQPMAQLLDAEPVPIQPLVSQMRQPRFRS